MTIENLKQIAIKYATTKGSRVPLAPDELCNAVVQYFNEFLKITADINTIQVAVTEEGGNIVFTITGNTLDGKAFTPIVITVDHNDFVTDQEFEAFKTNILDTIESLNNSITEINNTIKNINDNLENNTTDITTLKNRVDNTETNIADLEEKIPSTDNFLLKNGVNIINYSKFKIIDEIGSNIIGKSDSGNNNMSIGSSNYAMQLNSSTRPIIYTPAATYELAYINDIPAYKDVYRVSYDSTNGAIIAYYWSVEIHIPLLAGENVTIAASEDNTKIVISAAGGGGTGDVTAAGNNTFTGENTFTNEITFNTMKSEAGYIQFGSFNYETTEGYDYLYIDNTHINIQKFVGNNQYHEININADLMTYAPPDDNVYYEYSYPRKNGTFALTSDIPDTSSFVTLAGDNTFGGTNTFNNSIYAKNGIVAGDTTNYGANSVTKGSNTYSFPNKNGTFAMTNDIINEPIYFISFYANAPSKPCHLIGTMMSKNSYGTGQKTNEEFAVILADNLYTNCNEGLAVYGRLANKDILCIYSEDGLSIRYLDEENSDVDLPMVMFFLMETEL